MVDYILPYNCKRGDNMTAEVYFANLRSKSERDNTSTKIRKLFDKANIKGIIGKDELAAVKMHFGEKGNDAYISPLYVRQIVDKIKEAGGKPFLTDSNTLYRGSRSNAVDHITTAIENGFAYSVVGAPIIIADGLRSKNSVEVEINKKNFHKVKLALDIVDSDCMVVLSHFKGHEMAGFGGVIKNLAMGCASPSGKQQQHSRIKPRAGKRCVGCGNCVCWCPVNAISISEKKAQMNPDLCIGCGECISACPIRAISPNWDTEISDFLERMTEYAYGVHKVKKGKIAYINFVMNVSPNCDCCGWADAPIVPDVGILASFDPVAIDQASFNLVNKQHGFHNSELKCNHEPGKDKFKGMRSNIDAEIQTIYGEKLGMGTRQYEIINI